MNINQKGITFLTAVIIVAFLLGVTGCAVVKQQENKKPVVIDETPSNLATTNWKTYTNTQYGFLIQYPVDSQINDGLDSDSPGISFTLPSSSDALSHIFYVNVATKAWYNLGTSNGIFRSPANCNDFNPSTATSSVNIDGVNFIKGDVGSAATAQRSSATEYCLLRGDIAYKLTPSIQYSRNDATSNGFDPAVDVNNDTVFNQMVSTFKFTPPSTAATGDWKTYTNEKYGFNFQYPQNYSVTIPPQSSDFPAAVDIFYLDPQRGTSASQLMRVLVDSTSKPSSFEGYLKMRPLRDANSGTEYLFKNFTQRKIGDNVFYSILTERFEGTLAFSYYTIIDKKVFIFLIQSQGVAWTDPKLDTENDTYHVIFRKILSTFKFTTSSTTVPATVTSQAILNLSNSDYNFPGYKNGYTFSPDKNKITFGDLDGDGINEAVASVVSCAGGASCWMSVYVFKLYQGQIKLTEINQTSVSGAAQNIDSLQIKNGLVVVTETDFSGTRTNSYKVQFINGQFIITPQ